MTLPLESNFQGFAFKSMCIINALMIMLLRNTVKVECAAVGNTRYFLKITQKINEIPFQTSLMCVILRKETTEKIQMIARADEKILKKKK